jgi:hypothetical protein
MSVIFIFVSAAERSPRLWLSAAGRPLMVRCTQYRESFRPDRLGRDDQILAVPRVGFKR